MVTSNSWQRISADAATTWTGEVPRNSTGRNAVPLRKQILDVAVASLALLALSPLLLLLALAVALDSRGPVVHISRRVGRNGRIFPCFKFRTMTGPGAVSRLGSFLRRYGLDELPQFVNVLRGEMSIVGPRPLLAPVITSDSKYRRLHRFELQPGMTGLWAVQEAECEPFTAYVSPDETYRRNWSLRLDLMIMVRSLAAALAGRGL